MGPEPTLDLIEIRVEKHDYTNVGATRSVGDSKKGNWWIRAQQSHSVHVAQYLFCDTLLLSTRVRLFLNAPEMLPLAERLDQ